MVALLVSIGLIFVLAVSIGLYFKFSPQFGVSPKKCKESRIINSPNYVNGKFRNLVKTTITGPGTNLFRNGMKFMKKIPGQIPSEPIESVKFDKEQFLSPSEKIKICWFGHSSLLINLEGKVVLIDPVFSKRASPFKSFGVKSFEYTNTFSTEELPGIDFVLLSHDHFDHLDYNTIIKIDNKVKKYYAPLGVGAHLKFWGIHSDKIVELDWWERSTEEVELEFIALPARHFSGRIGFMMDYTLWCSWIINFKNRKMFYCGDSGYGDHFKTIGEKFGPFEVTMMECGQYNEGWPFIHMNPEESVHAHIDLKGKNYIPIHWGKFKLSVHTWNEPLERAIKESDKMNVYLSRHIPGEIIEY